MKTETGTTRRSVLRGCRLAAFVAAVAGIGPALSGIDAAAQDAAKGPIVMLAGDLTDPFFGALKRGADDAARDLGVSYTYLPVELNAADLAKAIESAAATDPAGLAFGDWFPETQDPLVLKLAQEGTPVVGFNSGPENWRESTGALAWVSQNDKAAGVMAGERLAQAGVRHALCVNHLPGTVLNKQRCNGLAEAMAAAGGTSSVLSIPWSDATNPAKVMQAIQDSLNANNKIDGIFALGSSIARDAIRAAGGRQVTIGTVDLSSAVLEDVANGDLLFAIDQQPYLQGFYAIAILAQEIKYGMHLVGQVSTGPVAITEVEAPRVIAINSEEPGIRGAL
jgi:simple sugar transport system substrate-binding protein